MERSDLSTLDWFRHLHEELLDAAVYMERIIQDAEQALKPKELGLAECKHLKTTYSDYDYLYICADCKEYMNENS